MYLVYVNLDFQTLRYEADQIMLQVAKSDAKMITSNLDNPDYHAIIKRLLSE